MFLPVLRPSSWYFKRILKNTIIAQTAYVKPLKCYGEYLKRSVQFLFTVTTRGFAKAMWATVVFYQYSCEAPW